MRVLRTLAGAVAVTAAATTFAMSQGAKPLPEPYRLGAGAPVAQLKGRWAGSGEAQYSNGSVERFKCVATYFLQGDGGLSGSASPTNVQQNLRCQSDNYKLSLSAQLRVSGGAITGTWEEKIYNLKGRLQGSVTPDGFSVVVANEFTRANVSVAMSACEQTVTIAPRAGESVRVVKASLRKC